MTNTLIGQVALITGATRGIGAAILTKLAAQGATVIGTATTESGALSIQERIGALGVKGQGAVLDVTDAAQTEALLKSIESAFGAVTILVNNAGITRDNLMMRMKDEEWSTVIDTNLTSIFRLSRGVIKAMMKARAGRIINIALWAIRAKSITSPRRREWSALPKPWRVRSGVATLRLIVSPPALLKPI